MRSMMLLCAALLALGLQTNASAQSVALTADAEYEGAFLRSTPHQVNFYDSGRLKNGVLKVEYIRDGLVYSADSFIWFFEDGTVWKGVLRDAQKVGDLTFDAGNIEYFPSGAVMKAVVKESTSIDGLLIPLKSDVTFREDGRISKIEPLAQTNLLYRVLHRTIRGNNFAVSWNRDAGRYEFQNYVAGVNQIVARVANSWTLASIPAPFSLTPVVVPPGSTMTANNANPAETYWYVPPPGGYVLNGVNYGPGVILKVRDMQLLTIQVSQSIVIGGVTYGPRTSIAFDGAGRPSPVGM